MMELLWWGPIAGVAALVYAAVLAYRVKTHDPGTPEMQAISGAIRSGAMAFLAREYRAIALFVAVLFAVLASGLVPGIALRTAAAFLLGAGCSVSAGYFGMRVATQANTRTAQAARSGLASAVAVAFPGGAVMGMTVVGLGLLGVGVLYMLFRDANQVIGFSLGASSVALFARVGGGIYTKGADVGADLVGKIEAGIPEDDPRNPAVIADAVGDNVGDVAGMGADLFESYVGTVIAAIAIGFVQLKEPGVLTAVLLSGAGIAASIIGTLFVRGHNPQQALRRGMLASAAVMTGAAFLVVRVTLGDVSYFWAVAMGLASGVVIGQVAEYYTSGREVRNLAASALSGPAPLVIEGTAQGMLSVALPLLVIALSTIFAFHLAGFYGIALAAVGMLSITGMTVSVDAYGPIADNSAGIAEMSHLGPGVRQVADSLDAAGNTTAAIAKGFAIGSAALTALVLFFFYRQAVGIQTIDLLNPGVLAGLLLGGAVPFLFAALAMRAVGRTAQTMVGEVRRQFRSIKGLMEGEAGPDYARCVDIATQGALREMVVPGLLAVLIPIAVGVFLGKEALGGLLGGAIVTGVPLALYLANAGGAWDNAKKYIEAGHHGGKGSDPHRAAVIGDTVGDPFKDTAGPALNILIKLMTVVALVFAPLFR
ncbi:MAG: sodium-translocating pyrophosphatase [Armatimonadetes bacterium]|nr:sodium-translocating pyrophosphatase [Armatimonadota bacterium]